MLDTYNNPTVEVTDIGEVGIRTSHGHLSPDIRTEHFSPRTIIQGSPLNSFAVRSSENCQQSNFYVGSA